jgi:hypothetical protein
MAKSDMNILGETDTSLVPPPVSFDLDKFLHRRRAEGLAQLEQHVGLLCLARSSKTWVKETLAILQYYCQNRQETNVDLLSQNRQGVKISIPFQLSIDSFPRLAKSVTEIGDDSNGPLLHCFEWHTSQNTDSSFRLQWGPNEYRDCTMYIPYGYEELERGTDEKGAQEDDRYIYLIQLSPDESAKDAFIMLEEIESIAFLKREGVQSADEDLLAPAYLWFRESLSIRVIPTLRLT